MLASVSAAAANEARIAASSFGWSKAPSTTSCSGRIPKIARFGSILLTICLRSAPSARALALRKRSMARLRTRRSTQARAVLRVAS